MKELTSPKKGQSKLKSHIKKNSIKAKSPTVTVVVISFRNLKTTPKKEKRTKKKDLETAIQETLIKLNLIAQKIETGKSYKTRFRIINSGCNRKSYPCF